MKIQFRFHIIDAEQPQTLSPTPPQRNQLTAQSMLLHINYPNLAGKRFLPHLFSSAHRLSHLHRPHRARGSPLFDAYLIIKQQTMYRKRY